jgi:hypothetical protein
MKSFQDIKIIGVDKNKINRPDPEKQIYDVFFELSEVPPSEWIDVFNGERRTPSHSLWRKAWIEGKYVVVNCTLEELGQQQKDLNENIATSNKQYKEYSSRLEERNQQKISKAEEEKKKINDALDKLKF